MELGVLGPLHVRQFGLPVAIPGAKPRNILTFLGLHGGAVVPADALVELLWGADPPRTAAKALQTHISALRRALGDGFVLTQGAGWTLNTADTADIDAVRYTTAARLGRDALAAGDATQAVARFGEALNLWRGTPELPDGRRGDSERTRWIEGHAALVEDRADALLATGRAAELVGELEAAIADAPLRERRWGHLMLALYRAGRQGEALAAYQRARTLLADELGVDPGPELRRLESAIVAQDSALELPSAQQVAYVMRAVTFLLTDIEGSTAAWEADADAMAAALARHDELVERVVTFQGGRLIKTRGEGDATFSVFDRPSVAAAAAIELQEAIGQEPWALAEPMRIRIALHTGEVEVRDGDFFGRAVNRAARLRSLAVGGQILCSGATAELVIDSLADDVVLADLGMRQLKNLARQEHVFELRLQRDEQASQSTDEPLDRPDLPGVLTGPGPFVGRSGELDRLLADWQATLIAGTRAVLIAGEPGVGKTRLAGEWSRRAYDDGAIVLYGRCDEDLGAPYQPFAEALRAVVPNLGTRRLRGLRGVESLLPLVPGLAEVLPDLSAAPRADPDTERYALFDAVVALLGLASADAPLVLVLDDLHWAAKPTLLLLRHVLRFGEHARVQIVATYRSTDLDRTHPLAAMLADLHRDGAITRIALDGLDEDDVTTYVSEAGYDDDELARALASVTGGNPFFLIEALRHVDESGGRWDPHSLPQGVRDAVSRRLSRLPVETNKALAAAAVVGSRFAVDLVERVTEQDLVDAFDDAAKAGIVIEEPGGRYRFNHAIVRQSLLAELASMRRMRLHHSIAIALESEPGADDELLAELAYHYFECAWAGNAAKAVEYCRRAADQAMARLGYEGAADLYDKARHALEELDEELPDRDDQHAALLVARCEALLAAGDVASAAGAVAQLRSAAGTSARLAAWGTCFDGQLAMLVEPERLDDVEVAVGEAADTLAELQDAEGEAKAHTVRAGCLARLGRVGDCENALDQALTAARRAREHRRVNAVLAGAPLAALWGPNPVPRAGGRCLDVVRLLRITAGSPVVEATSTRCQGVLDALRGRAAAGRQLIGSARRTLDELGMRHAVLEVEQFAGIVELIADDPAAAEGHLRRAHDGFRRMGLDADTAETAALLARACLALGRDAEADELCMESEQLSGHAFKAAIAWRIVRAELQSRQGDHDAARRTATDAVAIAERTDALVDHGDACLALATVLDAAGDVAGARTAAQRAVDLYEAKGATALSDRARRVLGTDAAVVADEPERPTVEPDNACVQVGRQMVDAVNRQAWDVVEQLLAPEVELESHRKIVGFAPYSLPATVWREAMERYFELGITRCRQTFISARGDRLALAKLSMATEDASAGSPRDEFLQVAVLDREGRIALQIWFDVDDADAAMAELEARHAQLESDQRRTALGNAATRADDRLIELFGDNRLDAVDALFTEDTVVDDRRQGLRRESHDRATAVANIRAIAALGASVTKQTLAVRGNRLCLGRLLFEQHESQLRVEALELTEVDADGLMVAKVEFDPDDLDAAVAELEARYLAGEAAGHAQMWSLVVAVYAALNRHEFPAATPRCVTLDRRSGGAAFGPGELAPYLQAGWALGRAGHNVVAVHRLSDRGVVVTHASTSRSPEGFVAEWREVDLLVFEGALVSRGELFDETDLDVALARFDELCRPVPVLENTASRVDARFNELFAERNWVGLSSLMAADTRVEDRRAGLRREVVYDGDSGAAEARAMADLGLHAMTSRVIAIRGDRLVLCNCRYVGRDTRPDAFHTETLRINEIDGAARCVASISFDVDDLDAAFAELDARYLAGEAAPHAQTWSVITQAYAEMARGEVPATTTDLMSVDHRHVAALAPDHGIAYLRASWELAPEFTLRIEAVHRLSDYGAVFTRWSHGISDEGFEAEWRAIDLIAVDGGRVSRGEIFDESDLEAARTRFDEIDRSPSRLDNAAIRVCRRFRETFATRDWAATAELVADDLYNDDRRHVVNAGLRRGLDSVLEDFRTAADIGVPRFTADELATRGERLVLARGGAPYGDDLSEVFRVDTLQVAEIDAEGRIAALVMFDADAVDAAYAELEARYLAGEAAPHAHTWSVIAQSYAAFNRHEFPAATPDWATIDHRGTTSVEPADLPEFIRSVWDDFSEFTVRIEKVHRLTQAGAVVTQVSKGIARQGFEAEWRELNVVMISGELTARSELFDESDLDAALARFDELDCPATRLENTASRTYRRFIEGFATRDWAVLGEVIADDVCHDDRRRVVNGGIQHGRDAVVANMRAVAGVGVGNLEFALVATRGDRLALGRERVSGDERPDSFGIDVLVIAEVDADNRFSRGVAFDVDDADAAFAELDARYVAGEAAAHADTWSVVARSFAAVNRHELPATSPDWINVDHRRLVGIVDSGLLTSVSDMWSLTEEFAISVAAVHRLTDLGAIVTYVVKGTSRQGFDGEWRELALSTVTNGVVDRCELFDEADLDAAMQRFDELSRTQSNAASRAYERLHDRLSEGDWTAMADLLADDFTADDRRHVVGAGIRRGRDAQLADLRAICDLGLEHQTPQSIATRGARLLLTRARFSDSLGGPDEARVDVLEIVEVDVEDRIVGLVVFDPDDLDAALAELDTRYLAGEAARPATAG